MADASKGKRLGGYILGETIGQGSFGKVKIATDEKTNEKVAIKIVEKSTISDVEDVERVYRETFILTTLKHENIIKLFEVIDTAEALFLAMEFADGGELLKLVTESGRLDEARAHRLFREIVSGMEYCHRMKIIHRDLKLENILLDSKGTVKIADFGLSNSIKFGQKMDTNCGTPSYTCPEQILEKKYAGAAADIWSLGIILFAMVSGFLPFEAQNVPSLFKKITRRQFRFPAYVSKECQSLIDRMLTLDPEKRITISEIRGHSWYLMDYNQELLERLATMPPVTAAEIAQARKECLSVGEDGDAPNERVNDRDRLERLEAHLGHGGGAEHRPTHVRTRTGTSSGDIREAVNSKRNARRNLSINTGLTPAAAQRGSSRSPKSANDMTRSESPSPCPKDARNPVGRTVSLAGNTGRKLSTVSNSSASAAMASAAGGATGTGTVGGGTGSPAGSRCSSPNPGHRKSASVSGTPKSAKPANVRSSSILAESSTASAGREGTGGGGAPTLRITRNVSTDSEQARSPSRNSSTTPHLPPINGVGNGGTGGSSTPAVRRAHTLTRARSPTSFGERGQGGSGHSPSYSTSAVRTTSTASNNSAFLHTSGGGGGDTNSPRPDHTATLPRARVPKSPRYLDELHQSGATVQEDDDF